MFDYQGQRLFDQEGHRMCVCVGGGVTSRGSEVFDHAGGAVGCLTRRDRGMIDQVGGGVLLNIVLTVYFMQYLIEMIDF